MKLIMESWKRFLKESEMYDYRPENFGPLSMYHTDAGQYGQIVLYHMMPKTGDNLIYLVGSLTYDETMEPCIPTTFQVSSVYVEKLARGKQFSKILYDLAFYIVGDKGGGLTSDHMVGTTDIAKDKAWKYINAASEGEYRKRKTEKPHENSKFDYTGEETPDDPKDDCDAGVKGPEGLATDHSYEKVNTSDAGATYKELIRNHLLNLRYLRKGKNMGWLEQQLVNRADEGFNRAHLEQTEGEIS
tara:strand:+ start:983 stop:1714 length:732 start_codon:yes stop_codon:yes gene_type:complete